jgi:organic hydroperoxide reductase OsmC/OhrA
MEPHIYNVDIAWSKDRKGMMCSPDLNVNNAANCVEVATPPEFPKGIPGIWSPEHLFTAAVSSCLMTTFLAIAENSKLDFLSFTCGSKGKLEQVDGKFLMTEVLLEPVVTVRNEHDREGNRDDEGPCTGICRAGYSIKSPGKPAGYRFFGRALHGKGNSTIFLILFLTSRQDIGCG